MSLNLITKKAFLLARGTLLVLVLCFVANATGNEVDLTFNAVPSKDLVSDAGNLAIQPDGKILIFGQFQLVNGLVKTRFARLNSDGTLDNSFYYAPSNFTSFSKVIVQPDGKILVSGNAPFNSPKLVRLNSDGSVDGSFTAPWTATNDSGATVYAVQADGKIFAAHHHPVPFSFFVTSLNRLNSDGSIDNSFTEMGFEANVSHHFLRDLILLPSGQILISGKHTNGYIFRVNSDGSKDNSFESPLLGTSSFSSADSIARQSDGKVLFTGDFTNVNGINRTGISRLNADGTLDTVFPQSSFNGTVRVLPTDKFYVGIRRFNSDGTVDNTFSRPASLLEWNNWVLDGLERIVLFGGFSEIGGTDYKFARLNTDGGLDLSFSPIVKLAGTVNTMAVQSDGRTLVYGDFSQMNGVLRHNFARLDLDGALDPTFDAGAGVGISPDVMVVQPNGKILLCGSSQVKRIEANGNLDPTFGVTVDTSVFTIALQTDDKILIGGPFTTVNGPTRRLLARLNSNGTTDASFNPQFGTGSISSIVVQSNDKIIVGGTFSGVSGVARTNMARLNPDGGVDTSFNAGSISNVSLIVVQPDGKYLVSTNSGSTIRRLNVDGSADNTFQSQVFAGGAFGSTLNIEAIVVEADGSVVIGGTFATVNGVVRSNLVRLTSLGALDTAFLPSGANGIVNSVVTQPGGKLIIGGTFTLVNNVGRAGIARLNTVAFQRIVDFDYDGDSRADVSVYRSSNNYWYLSRSSDSQFTYHYFGAANDIAVPADYDGDGKTDLAIFRSSSGDWWYQSSVNGAWVNVHWGSNGDIPLPSDIDGDGKADYVVYRATNNRWYRLSSGSLQYTERYFGAANDKPLVGDFDGDGKADPAIFRPSTGVFWYMSSIDSVHRAIPWGTGSDIPAPADYDGDGKTDAAVYRPSTGFWYIYFSATNTYSFTNFGITEDKPIPADYDGDGHADIAVYRPSTGTWYLLRSTEGFTAQQFGNSTDLPTPNAFVPPMP